LCMFSVLHGKCCADRFSAAWYVCASHSLMCGKSRAPYFDACEMDVLRLCVPRQYTPVTKQRLTPDRNKHTDRDTDIKLLFMFSTLEFRTKVCWATCPAHSRCLSVSPSVSVSAVSLTGVGCLVFWCRGGGECGWRGAMCSEEGRGGMGRGGVCGKFAHLTLCCTVSVARLTLMHAMRMCAETRVTRHQTPDRENSQTETLTSNFCSCFQRWNAERKYVGLHAPHTLDHNFNVENMNNILMSVCVSSCVFVWCLSDWCRWSGVLGCVSLCGCSGGGGGGGLGCSPPL
jgi:hypothetical protein